MNIAFLSSLDPINIRNWSGTLYYMYRSLKNAHHITWVGGELYNEILRFHRENKGEQSTFLAEEYAPLFGKLLSDRFNYECYDFIICRDYFFLAYLLTDVPVIYIGDTTFRLFNHYLNYTDSGFIALAEEIEKRAIQKATHIVYASQWAKNSAVEDYHADSSKVSVFEFGANIDEVPVYPTTSPDAILAPCNLLFVGRDWRMKGGTKAIEAYKILKNKGFDCTLTIVGSMPDSPINDMGVHLHPYIDKSAEEGKALLCKLFREAHFLIAPTLFDCFGVIYSEAAAYGIPVLTTDVGGVAQAVCEGSNGFLFPADCPADCYAERIMELYTDRNSYETIRKCARTHYETRLNWNVWLERMNDLLVHILDGEEEGMYIPVYAINLKEREDRKQHILHQFEGRNEFDFHLVEACTHTKGTIGLWNSIVKIVKQAKAQEEDVIVICEDDHYFTEHYSWRLLLKEIQEAYSQGAEILSGGIGGFGQAIPAGYHRYWVDWFWSTQFIVIYVSLFDTILSYNFKEDDTADGVLSVLAHHKMVVYPFISEQIDFGYSDVTQGNIDNQGRVREYFEWANKRFEIIEKLSNLKTLTDEGGAVK